MKERKQRTLGIFALALALVATTVAYAALSTTLTISGSVTKKGGTWGIQIVDVSNFTTSGSATTTGTKPTLTGNTSLNFSANLYKPNDSVSFTFKVKNTGSVNAAFPGGSSLLYYNSSSTSGSEAYTKVDKEGILCSMTYGGKYLYNYITVSETNVTGMSLNAGQTSDIVTVKCTYKDTSTIDASDKNLSFSINLPFVQTN